jgi:ribose 5-phosphate isomerase B
MMCVGIAADHGGFALKGLVADSLRGSGYRVVDFGAHEMNAGDDYPDFIIPLARAIAAGEVERGVALCGSGVGASIAANKVLVFVPGSSMMFSPRIRALKMTT